MIVLDSHVLLWWLHAAETERLRFQPLDTELLVQSTRLPGVFHGDRADRMIVAPARHLNVPLVTSDQNIRAYKHVRTLWQEQEPVKRPVVGRAGLDQVPCLRRYAS